MVQAVRMPMMGNTMETGLLAEWRVAEGDAVEEDQVIAVVESEKAAADVVASQDGTLARVDVDEGEEVPPGTLVGVVLGDDEDLDDAPAPRSRIEPGSEDGPEASAGGAEADAEAVETDAGQADAEAEAAPTDDAPSDDAVRAAPGARRLAADRGVDLSAVDGTGPDGAVLIADVEGELDRREGATDESPAAATASGRTFAPPSTRRLARELGVSLDDVRGTGSDGRVTESDVRAAAGRVERPVAAGGEAADRSGASAAAESDADALGVTVAEERSLSPTRRTIAERMARSASEAPHVTLNRSVSVERAFRAASELADDADAPVGFTDVLVAATARALAAHPEFNAWFENDRLRLVEEANVAVAVDADAGLVTPVIREAGRRSLADLATERRSLTDAVLAGDYSMDDLRGGTFTVTNLGMFGVDSFDPVINPPQVAILGVGAVQGEEGDRTCTLSLSFDHRPVDGADAARFLDTLAGYVEAPTPLAAGRSTANARSPPAAEAATAADRDERPDDPGLAALVGRDVSDRAAEIAPVHDWPVPTFDVAFDDGRPAVTVRRPDGLSRANAARLAYAACRESTFASTVVGLRDPAVTVE